MGIFSKKSEETKSESDEMMDRLKESKSNIKYLESQYEIHLIKSLENDYELFKEDFSKSYNSKSGNDPSTRRLDVWRIESNTISELTLIKNLPQEESRASAFREGDVRFSIRYQGSDSDIQISNISCRSNGSYVTIDKTKINEISLKYLLFIKINRMELDLSEAKRSFNNFIKVIGKDTHRDAKIDSLLNR